VRDCLEPVREKVDWDRLVMAMRDAT
jgi:hypothetical protein